MANYLVERYMPGATYEQLVAAVGRLAAVTHKMRQNGIEVQHVTSTFVPAEEACFCSFEALSEEAVRYANEQAVWPHARILEVVVVAAKPDEEESHA